MNITELIKRQRELAEGLREPACEETADALKAQQVVIEKMVEFIEDEGQKTDGEFRSCCFTRASKPHESWCEFPKILALQPNLSALREHDAGVVEKFAKWASATMWAKHYIKRIRKGGM